MSIIPEVPAKTLSELVARQIRVAMAVEDIRQSQLARKMGKTEQWLSVRLRGRQAIDMNDLLLFAKALNVGIHQLLPPPDEAAQAVTSRQDIPRYLDLPVRTETHTDRPRDNRPAGKAGPSHPIGAARTAYVSRRPRGRRD